MMGVGEAMAPLFQLSACAEMLWPDKPLLWRVARLKERNFAVGLWNWTDYDIDALVKSGATFSIMNGYTEGRLVDDEGADLLLQSARQAVTIGKRLGVLRYNLHGTALGYMGKPLLPCQRVTGRMWLKAYACLGRICDLAQKENVVFTLENLNPRDHPDCPLASASDVLSLVSMVDCPHLRITLDLYHCQIGEGDLIRSCQASMPWLGEVQIADNPGRCEPGTGEINFGAIARALDEGGYRGAVGLEAYAKSDSDAALDAFERLFRP